MTPILQNRPGLRSFLENVLYILAAIVLAYFVQTFIIRPFIVSGTSMVPKINDGEYMIIDEVTYRARDPKRGEVIVFKAPPEPSKYYIKRVIGLPGETVKIEGSKVTIINTENPNGFILEESYIENEGSDYMTVKVPAGEFFVMGDNRNGSYDSRGWGTLPKDSIRGRALVRLLPLSEIDFLPADVSYEEDN